jgi:hypothetical protein
MMATSLICTGLAQEANYRALAKKSATSPLNMPRIIRTPVANFSKVRQWKCKQLEDEINF